MIAKVVGLDRSVISRNVQNTKISDMHNLLSHGHDMDYIARHYHHMDLALVWALRLKGKTDQEIIQRTSTFFCKALNSGSPVRTIAFILFASAAAKQSAYATLYLLLSNAASFVKP